MNCPNCQEPLTPMTYEGITIESCPGCEGEWLDPGELKHVVTTRDVLFDEEERRAIAAAARITPIEVDREDRDLVCPKCGGQTDAINYGGDSGIVIDKCTTCGGIWLDAGELEKVQMLVEGWQDKLPDDLKKHGPRLRQVADEVHQRGKVRISRFAFVNAIINGILDVGGL